MDGSTVPIHQGSESGRVSLERPVDELTVGHTLNGRRRLRGGWEMEETAERGRRGHGPAGVTSSVAARAWQWLDVATCHRAWPARAPAISRSRAAWMSATAMVPTP